jgi:seryl-tRNA synthetase
LISIERMRDEPDLLREAMAKRGEDVPIERILELDRARRSAIAEADGLRARRNEVSRQLGQMQERPPELIEEMRGVGDRIKDGEALVRKTEEEINSLLLEIPNSPADDVPLGEDETGNLVVRSRGEPQPFSFEPLPHWELGERLDIIDFQRGVKLSGSRFFVLKGKGAKLQRALISWMLDLHTQDHGYQEVYVPDMVNRASAIGSSHLPKFADTMYSDAEDDLWLLPTAEMAITSLHRDELLPPGTLPINYVAHTPCFRREKAAAGRDTRGIKRVHQFEKVEMYKLVDPAESAAELDKLVADAEEVCVRLGIPHRVLELCTGDLGFSAVKTYDVEMWASGCAEWLEVSSCSNCTDFQARRASIRYRSEEGARPRFVHTLNGSGLALPRVIIAILENFQQADGSVRIPEVLVPYTGFDTIGG